MSYQVVQPPAADDAFAAVGKELYDASVALGMTMDVEGFLLAWVKGTRVVVEKDREGQVVGMALVAVGKQWVTGKQTASVLEMRTPDPETMGDFVKQMAAVMGAESLYMDMSLVQDHGPHRIHTVIEYVLQ